MTPPEFNRDEFHETLRTGTVEEKLKALQSAEITLFLIQMRTNNEILAAELDLWEE